MLESFIICSKPTRQWQSLFGIPQDELDDVAVWRRRSRLESLTSQQDCVTLLHPLAGQEHFVALFSENDEAGHLAVTSPNAMDRLMEPGGLLLFGEGPSEETLLLHFEDRDRTQFFRRAVPSDFGLCGSVLDKHELGLCARCYKWSAESPGETCLLNVDIRVRPDVWAGASSDVEVAWLNPVIARLSVSGDDLAGAACTSREPPVEASPTTREDERSQVLRCMTEPQSLLYCQPVFDLSYDARMVLLDHLDGWRDDQNPSGAERLYFGSKFLCEVMEDALLDSPNWLPYLSLDSLGGDFAVTHHGNKPQVLWSAPASFASGNGRWFARHWLKRWGGEEAAPALRFDALPQTSRTRDGWGRPSVVSLPLDSTCLGPMSSSKLLLLTDAHDGDRELFSRVNELLDHMEIQELKVLEALRGAWHTEIANDNSRSHRTLFDKAEFLTRLCAAVLQPESDVWLKLDLPRHTLSEPMERQTMKALGNRWLNVFDTPSYGQRDWIERIFTLAGRPKPTEVDILFESGWWIDWLDSFFSARWDVSVYLETGGMFLDQSRVDYGRMDQTPATYRQSEFVRF